MAAIRPVTGQIIQRRGEHAGNTVATVLGKGPNNIIVTILAHAELREREDVVPSAHNGLVAAAVVEVDFANGVGQKLANVGPTSRSLFCVRGSAVEDVDILCEAGTAGCEVTDAFSGLWASLKGLAVGGHKDAYVARAAAADVKVCKIFAGVWVDDTVPCLVGDVAAWAGAGSWGRPSQLVEHLKTIVFPIDHLGPGETCPWV